MMQLPNTVWIEPVDVITSLENQKDTPYNTYTRKGLPAGPITNPSYSAITWALYPADTQYYYFVAKKDGYNLFAKNFERAFYEYT